MGVEWLPQILKKSSKVLEGVQKIIIRNGSESSRLSNFGNWALKVLKFFEERKCSKVLKFNYKTFIQGLQNCAENCLEVVQPICRKNVQKSPKKIKKFSKFSTGSSKKFNLNTLSTFTIFKNIFFQII
jgi:hypothetical protein